MTNSNLKLKVTIVHFRFLNLGTITFGCSAHFELIDLALESQNPWRASIMNISLLAPTIDIKDLEYPHLFQLEQLSLTGSVRRGFQIRFGELKIDNIDFDERRHLLKFFKNMIGIKILFDDDICEMFDKLSVKNEITFDLPYYAWNY